MKKHFLSFLLCFPFLYASAQEIIPDTIVIFGADFSLCRLVTNNPYNMATVLKNDIPLTNTEMVKNCLSFASQFHAKAMLTDTGEVVRINASIDPDKFITNGHYILSHGDTLVRNVVPHYNKNHHANGYGFLFVMERIDEIDNRESYYIVMFDLKSGKIIHCDKVETGLSRVKNAFESGWFSWKTGIFNTLRNMDDVYDFWYNYPESRPVNMDELTAPKQEITPTLADKKKENETKKGPGMKDRKIISLYGSITMLADGIADDYTTAFQTTYGAANVYKVMGNFSVPKFNLSFDYGFARKHSVGISVGMDHGDVEYRDTTANNGGQYEKDFWNRKQIALRYSYYFVALPHFNLYSGPQFGYNIYQRTTTETSRSIVAVEPLKINFQIGVGAEFFIKKHVKIGLGGSLGFGGNDYFWFGTGYKF